MASGLPSAVINGQELTSVELANALHDPNNLRFYHAVVLNVPTMVIDYALRAVFEQAENGGIKRTKGAYFCWLIKNWGICEYNDPYPWRKYRKHIQTEIPEFIS